MQPSSPRTYEQAGKTIRELFASFSHLTDKGSMHSYLDFYDQLFSPLREKPILIVEIGVLVGGSLMLWDSYFCHAEARIVGVDINTSTRRDGRVEYVQGDGTDEEIVRKIGQPDIVIDDGSHTTSDQCASFICWWPSLKPGGVYVIEDIQNDEQVNALLALHAFQEIDYRHVKSRYDDRLLTTRK